MAEAAARNLPVGLPAWDTKSVGGVVLALAPPCARIVLRGADALQPACTAMGLAPPARINRASASGSAAVLALGPDEWLLLDEASQPSDLQRRLEHALASVAASVVDVSQRQLGLIVAGPAAVDALATGVPLDLDPVAFPVGMATRTIFEKTEIVLWRRADGFRIEVWRSFAPYLAALLEAARTELAAGL